MHSNFTETSDPVATEEASVYSTSMQMDWKEKCIEIEKKLKLAEEKLKKAEKESEINQKKLTEADKIIKRNEKLRIRMKRSHQSTYKKLKRKINNLETKHATFSQHFEKIFTPDQVDLITKKYKKIPEWHNDSLKKAFKYKFACGISGYEEIITSGIPLPCNRTLTRQLEGWRFKAGILNKVFEFLEAKVPAFSDQRDKDCVIVIDEVAITSGKIYDPADGSFLGYVTLHKDTNPTEIAESGLVFMLAGIGGRWKQPVAFHFTNKSTDGSLYYPVLIELLKKCEKIGLRVRGIISDMAGANQGLWRIFGISVSRYSLTKNKCSNPSNKDRQLYFFHDPAHAWKNFKEGFFNAGFITIPDKFVKKYNLPTSKATISHFKHLVDTQNNSELLLTPGLNDEMLVAGHFKKMRVENTSNVLSHNVSAALSFLSEAQNLPELRTTAWLVSMLSRWWRIVSCRNLSLALSKKNPQVYKETVDFLKEFIELISGLSISANGHWKPFQTGLIISTQSLIELAAELLNENYDFVIPGRFSQDCLENLFSALRVKNMVMNALQFKNNLKLISVALYMRTPSGSSYNEDDRNYLLDFLTNLKVKKKEKINP